MAWILGRQAIHSSWKLRTEHICKLNIHCYFTSFTCSDIQCSSDQTLTNTFTTVPSVPNHLSFLAILSIDVLK
jgi:hypothetical protein